MGMKWRILALTACPAVLVENGKNSPIASDGGVLLQHLRSSFRSAHRIQSQKNQFPGRRYSRTFFSAVDNACRSQVRRGLVEAVNVNGKVHVALFTDGTMVFAGGSISRQEAAGPNERHRPSGVSYAVALEYTAADHSCKCNV